MTVKDARSGPHPGTAPSVEPSDGEWGIVGASDADHEAFAELQRLLVGRERDQLAAILGRLEDPEARRREVAELLPHVLLDHSSDPRFTHALTPPVERAITASVRQNPGPLADALFPVMGPAIRKAVAAALSGMVEALNRTLEHSLSWRSIAWRFEALRTGKSFGEVMLLHTLVYRVEQVFLIERPSGLLLQHVTEGADTVRDADMVSGMLTAIRDFVQDSFQVGDGEALESLNVGALSVWIEQGPRAIIAAVIRGTAPRTLRTTLQAAIERIHLEFTDEFDQFRGDTAPFEGARPTLDACLHTEYRSDARPNGRSLWLAAALIGIALVVWGGFAWRARSRWNGYLESLRSEPGLIVVSTERRDGKYGLAGLRDPLARDPGSLLAGAGLRPEDISAKWEPYYAAHPALALVRARTVLRPPEGVTLELQDGVLKAVGAAPLAWLAEASRVASLIPGVSSLDASGPIEAAVRSAISEMESLSPLFVKGETALARGQDEVLRQMVARASALERTAATLGQTFHVEIIGHTDADGPVEANLPLSRARAEVIHHALGAVATDRLVIVEAGVGSDDPAVESASEVDKQRNRRVTVRVTPMPPGAPPGAPRP